MLLLLAYLGFVIVWIIENVHNKAHFGLFSPAVAAIFCWEAGGVHGVVPAYRNFLKNNIHTVVVLDSELIYKTNVIIYNKSFVQ